MRGLFVTGTDTAAGKTAVSAALIAAITASGEPVRAYKPVVTGLEDQLDRRTGWPHDHELLASLDAMTPADVSPLRYGTAASPHLAAQLAGERIAAADLLAAAQALAANAIAACATVIVEGVGGLLVPLTDDCSVCDLAAEVSLPLLIAARPGLGTINHTLLTVRAAREAGLEVQAVVLTPWPDQPRELELSNRETIERLGEVEVKTLAQIARPERDELARAGESLPWRRWLARSAG